jgi:hypothetical protein
VAKKGGLNPDLERAVNDLLKTAMSDPDVDMDAKLKIIDRAINLEKIKQKISEDEWGSGFLQPEATDN